MSSTKEATPVNPNDLDYLIGFKDFIYWLKLSGKFNANDENDELYNKYLQYRKLFHSRQVSLAFILVDNFLYAPAVLHSIPTTEASALVC